MKKIFYPLFFLIFSNSCFSQGRVVELSHYIFPDFTKGTVLLKNGKKNETKLNYNSLTEEMVFENNGTKLALGQVELVDTVFINGRKFFPLKDKFVELIYKAKSELYAEHKCSVREPGKPAAYGGTSQVSSTTSYSSIFSGGQAYELALPDGFETKPYTEYWLKKDGELNKFISLRQVSKLFGNKEALSKEFIKKHDLKIENQSGVAELIKFLEEN